MIVELVLAFVLCLVVLKRFFFKDVTYVAILGLTALLVVLIAATNYPLKPAAPGTELFSRDDDDYTYGGGRGVRETFVTPATASPVAVPKPPVRYLGTMLDTKNQVPVSAPVPAKPKAAEEHCDIGKGGTGNIKGAASVDVKALLTENIDEITKSLQSFHISSATAKLAFYYSVYSPVSYSATGRTWKSMTCAKTNLVFSAAPGAHNNGIDLIRGMPLGLLSLTGPNSSNIGFSSHGAFTIFFQVRFSDLAKKEKMHIISLYSASPASTNTGGMIVRLANVNRDDLVQTAQLVIVLSNNTPLYCTIEGKTQLPFDENVTYVFSIVKTATTIDVFMSSSTFRSVLHIMKRVNLRKMDNFANIPMTLNGNKNIDGKIMAFGGYNINLNANDVERVHDYLLKQEKRVNDKDYVEALVKIKALEDRYRKISSCPLDAATCNKCTKVDWMHVLETANKECIGAIEAHCTKTVGAEAKGTCACWNPKGATYNSIRCVNIRKATEDKALHNIDQLDNATVAAIKKKYNVCPAPAKPPAKPPTCVPATPKPHVASPEPPLSPEHPEHPEHPQPPQPQQPLPPPQMPPPPPPPPLPTQPKHKCTEKKKKCHPNPGGGGMGRDEPKGLMSWLGAMFDV
jgi:hypothetical protein